MRPNEWFILIWLVRETLAKHFESYEARIKDAFDRRRKGLYEKGLQINFYKEFCMWVRRDGGQAAELEIFELCRVYDVEIDVHDIENGRRVFYPATDEKHCIHLRMGYYKSKDRYVVLKRGK